MNKKFDSTQISLWMNEALLLAKKAASLDEVPVGALVLFENQISGRGFNQRERLKSPFAHAEMLAIDEASRRLGSWRLTGCTLIATLEPCPMCLASCQQARIEQVFYGATDPKGGTLSLGYAFHQDARTHHRFEVSAIPTPMASTLLSDFFKLKRKRKT